MIWFFLVIHCCFCYASKHPRDKHDARGSDYLSCRANALDNIATLFLCDGWRLEQDHGEPRFVSLDLDVLPHFKEDLFIVTWMFHRGLGACDDTRAEYLGLRIQTLGWTCKLEGQQ